MYIYTDEEIRQADTNASNNGLSVNALMETAGRSLFYKIEKLIKKGESILILSGRGNNGGDGIVLARYLQQNGYNVDLVFPFGEPKTETANEHLRFYQSVGYSYLTKMDKTKSYQVIIDAMLGVGTRQPIREEYITVIKWCNEQNALKISVDLPTGVLANRGDVETAFIADYTYALHGVKPSAFSLPSSRYYGRISSINIGLPQNANWRTWTEKDVNATLKKRSQFTHKGTFGTGLLVAGTDEMPGSAMLASLGALKMGIGKLQIATSPFASSIIATQVPEATFLFDGLEKLAKNECPEGIRAVAIGPGLIDQPLIEKALNYLWDKDIPLILDAGALYKRSYPKRQAPVILTPHPGEFSRITGMRTEEIQQNRLEVAKQFAVSNQVILVLKGTHTVIAYPDGTGYVNVTGNAGLAKGGSGDTLTGMILALVSNDHDVCSSVANAVYLHGYCANELVKENDERAIVAGDITTVLGKVIKNITEENRVE